MPPDLCVGRYIASVIDPLSRASIGCFTASSTAGVHTSRTADLTRNDVADRCIRLLQRLCDVAAPAQVSEL